VLNIIISKELSKQKFSTFIKIINAEINISLNLKISKIITLFIKRIPFTPFRGCKDKKYFHPCQKNILFYIKNLNPDLKILIPTIIFNPYILCLSSPLN